MKKLLNIWFKSLSFTNKFLIACLFLCLSFLSIKSVQLAASEYSRLKAVEKRNETLINKLTILEEKELTILNNSESFTKKQNLLNKSINTKTKKDEENIDNSIITDSDIKIFISKYN